MRRRLLTGGMVLAFLAVGSTVGAHADPVSLVHIRGTVTDRIGRPLAGVAVSDGSQVDYTDSAGQFHLDESAPGTRYFITSSRRDTLAQSASISAVAPGDYVHDFSLWYRAFASFDSQVFSTANGPKQLTFTLTSFAPFPGVAGQSGGASCVVAHDVLSNMDVQGSFLSDGGARGSPWQGTIAVPANAPGGAHDVPAKVVDCATGTELASAPRSYFIDNEAPALASGVPGPGHFPTSIGPSTLDVGAYVTDSGGAGLSSTDSRISVDGIDLTGVTFTSSASRLSATASGLAAGSHQVTMKVADYAGNALDLAWSFTVDDVGPVLSSAAPVGQVATSSPRISVNASDGDSGVSASSISMTLSNGVVTSSVKSTFDPASGLISYQVPTTPAGLGLGQFALPEGQYTASVSVTDIAGNRSNTSWTFTVHALPTP